MKELHLICNAHIDPVWQWDWQEAVGVTLSTFATAADLCEEYPSFIFNHNEALLYQWVEANDPELFRRIQRLVREGRWHIMGGWYLQPDCNLPDGESMIRQITAGRIYFREKFGVEPQVAASLDAFGHSRGLVQILRQAGYTGYVMMRGDEELPPAFRWQGYAGSEIPAVRLLTCYNTPLGKSADCIRDYIRSMPDEEIHFRFWGVGNHGGGPSRKDLDDLTILQQGMKTHLLHSTPEAYFRTLHPEQLPIRAGELGPVFVGCYTSMIRLKRLNRRLEGVLYTAEAAALLALQQKGAAYPKDKLDTAQQALLFCQFHDILAGTCTESAEESAVQRQHTGLQLAEECLYSSMYFLCRDEPSARPGETPLFVFQPLPASVPTYVECEFMLPDQNWDEEEMNVAVWCDGTEIPSQVLKEESNINLDWRKRIGFLASLRPMGITRFDLKLYKQKPPLRRVWKPVEELVSIETEWGGVTLRGTDGSMACLRRDGHALAADGFARLWSYTDTADPWSMQQTELGSDPQPFTLLAGKELAAFSGCTGGDIQALQIVEEGTVLTRVQMLLGCGSTRACVQFTVFRQQPWVDLEIRLYGLEPNKLCRLALPLAGNGWTFLGQDIAGVKVLCTERQEQVVQQWAAVTDSGGIRLGIVNDGIGGVCIRDGQLFLTLQRTPAYAAHPLPGRPLFAEQQFRPHMDRGLRIARFRLLPGPLTEEELDRQAQSWNTPPVVTPLFPRGNGGERTAMTVDGARLMAFRPALDGDGYILRLLRNRPDAGEVMVDWPAGGLHLRIKLDGYQIQTVRVTGGQAILCDLLEYPIQQDGERLC